MTSLVLDTLIEPENLADDPAEQRLVYIVVDVRFPSGARYARFGIPCYIRLAGGDGSFDGTITLTPTATLGILGERTLEVTVPLRRLADRRVLIAESLPQILSVNTLRQL